MARHPAADHRAHCRLDPHLPRSPARLAAGPAGRRLVARADLGSAVMSTPSEVAVRAWAVPGYLTREQQRVPGIATDLGPSNWTLIFDTATDTTLGQALRFLTWQERHRGRLRTTGIAYNPAGMTAGDVQTVRDYAAARGLRLLTVEEWIPKVLFNIGWAKRGTVVGFNLPFDLSRLAIGHHVARVGHCNRGMRGAWSFQLSTNPRLPRLQIKRISGRAAFIRFTTPDGRHPEARNRERGGRAINHRGYFVDASVTGAALLGRKTSLRSLGELLQTTTRKRDGEHGQALTRPYLDYAAADTQLTWECYQKLADRYAGYHLDTPLHRVYSEASVGKAHLRQMRLVPWRQIQPDVPDAVVATIMETYYGGRTETRIRR